jgi:hypothetical protein
MTASPPDNEAIFHAARHIPDPDRRREYVREACGGDEARIAHLEALLAAGDGPESLLDRLAAASRMATIDQPAAEGPRTVFGPYKLIEEIGEGGMGSVWMAQQTEPVKRLVAVKLIKAGMGSRQVIARFEAERQALAGRTSSWISSRECPSPATATSTTSRRGSGWNCSFRSARQSSTRIRRASSTAT